MCPSFYYPDHTVPKLGSGSTGLMTQHVMAAFSRGFFAAAQAELAVTCAATSNQTGCRRAFRGSLAKELLTSGPEVLHSVARCEYVGRLRVPCCITLVPYSVKLISLTGRDDPVRRQRLGFTSFAGMVIQFRPASP